jgi:hypothetical protein
VSEEPGPDPVHNLDPSGPFRYGNSWDWRKPRRGDGFRTCSYCGSIHPEDLAAPGWHASWADQKYGWPHKFYVEGLRPVRPDMLFCLGHSDQPSWGKQEHWVAAGDLTRMQKAIIRSGGMHAGGKFTGSYLFEPRASVHAKFYTRHLADPAVSDEVREAIAQVSGLRFRFLEDGRVGWYPASVPLHEHGD